MLKHLTLTQCRTFEELWDDDGETERERNKLISEVYNFVDIPTVTVGNEDEMPLISFGTGPAVENETRWEIKEAIQSGHRCVSRDVPVLELSWFLNKAQHPNDGNPLDGRFMMLLVYYDILRIIYNIYVYMLKLHLHYM